MKFKIDINLDDEQENHEFLLRYTTIKGRQLANQLGFTGPGAEKAANALSNYAWNKTTAIGLRKKGDITNALKYEEICDRIYREDIKNTIECW